MVEALPELLPPVQTALLDLLALVLAGRAFRRDVAPPHRQLLVAAITAGYALPRVRSGSCFRTFLRAHIPACAFAATPSRHIVSCSPPPLLQIAGGRYHCSQCIHLRDWQIQTVVSCCRGIVATTADAAPQAVLRHALVKHQVTHCIVTKRAIASACISADRSKEIKDRQTVQASCTVRR